jgi:hypothetical protein
MQSGFCALQLTLVYGMASELSDIHKNKRQVLRDYAVLSGTSGSVVKRKSVMKSAFKERDVGLVQ